MTRKDYYLIANAVRLASIERDPNTRDAIAQRLAIVLAGDNPQFKPALFLEACGVVEQQNA